MLNFLRLPIVIVLSFLVAVALVIAFQAWIPSVGGQILDRVSSIEDTTALLATMTQEQKNSHFWMTLLLDYAFPIAYGAFFAGLALQFPGRVGVALAIPALLVITADFAENTVQLMALSGNEAMISAKEVLTPTKSLFFLVAGIIALISLVWIAANAVRARRNRTTAS